MIKRYRCIKSYQVTMCDKDGFDMKNQEISVTDI